MCSVSIIPSGKFTNCVGKINQCTVKFEDTDSCACSDNAMKTKIICYNRTIWINRCYCMYYDPEKDKSIIGNCFFTCFYIMTGVIVTNTSTLNADMCSNMFNRQGRFCGECKEGHGLAVYSYHYYSCIQCRYYGYKNWLKYFTVAFLPLTLFYILAVLLRLNVTSSTFNGIVTVMHV